MEFTHKLDLIGLMPLQFVLVFLLIRLLFKLLLILEIQLLSMPKYLE